LIEDKFILRTQPEHGWHQIALLALKTPAARGMLSSRLSNEVIRASKKAIARVHPEFTKEQVDDYFIELHHGRELADAVCAYRKARRCNQG